MSAAWVHDAGFGFLPLLPLGSGLGRDYEVIIVISNQLGA